MYTDVNLDALKRCDANNVKCRRFDLGDFIHQDSCGTYGCLVGNDWLTLHADHDPWTGMFAWTREEYGLSTVIARWLFDSHDPLRIKGRGINCYMQDSELNFSVGERRPLQDLNAALNRLRKYITYIERKRAMLHEPDGRISERARKQEGNWLVCPSIAHSFASAV